MKTKELISYLKALPQESDVYFDDLKGGLIEICPPTIYAGDKLRRTRSDLESPVVVLAPIAEISKH